MLRYSGANQAELRRTYKQQPADLRADNIDFLKSFREFYCVLVLNKKNQPEILKYLPFLDAKNA